MTVFCNSPTPPPTIDVPFWVLILIPRVVEGSARLLQHLHDMVGVKRIVGRIISALAVDLLDRVLAFVVFACVDDALLLPTIRFTVSILSSSFPLENGDARSHFVPANEKTFSVTRLCWESVLFSAVVSLHIPPFPLLPSNPPSPHPPPPRAGTAGRTAFLGLSHPGFRGSAL